MKPTLIGRSSSHFTRVARLFAAELGLEYAFRVVPDLLSIDPADYAGNPALRIPILETAARPALGSAHSTSVVSSPASPLPDEA